MEGKKKVLSLYAHYLGWHGAARWWGPLSKAAAPMTLKRQNKRLHTVLNVDWRKPRGFLNRSAISRTMCVEGRKRSNGMKRRATECKAMDGHKAEIEREKLACDFQNLT